MLNLSSQARRKIVAHAREQAPVEACGYLAEKDGVVSEVFPLTNVDRATDHFTLDPAQQFAAVREMRASGYKLRAVFHSHPATPARPSPEDVRLAVDPRVSYVIVSLAAAEPDVKSFLIQNGVVTAEPIVVVESVFAGGEG
jgi:[CysO sulfur-carrier protein]-S-L-cysteine hydrolase